MTTTGSHQPSPGQDTTAMFGAVERARQQANEDKARAVLAADLVAESITTSAKFELAKPVDLPYDMPEEDRYRLLAVEVTSTRALGVRPTDPEIVPGEPPHVEVRGLVRELKADGTPYAKRYEHWVPLPSELAERLLGKAHVS